MLGACITFGLLAPVSKSLFGTGLVSAYALTMMRMGGGAVVFWIASLFTRREHVPPRDLLLFFFASLLGIVLNQGTYVLGVSKTSPIDASVVTTTTPIFVMVIAALYLREPITGKKILGVVVGAAGALLLILSGAHLVSGRTGSGSVSGDLLCLFAQLSFATYFVVFKKLISRYSPVTLMKWMFLYATACCLPFGYSDLKAVGWAELGLGGLRPDRLRRAGRHVPGLPADADRPEEPAPDGGQFLQLRAAAGRHAGRRFAGNGYVRMAQGRCRAAGVRGGVYRDDQQVEGAVGSRGRTRFRFPLIRPKRSISPL